jgi:hypothetical protein
MSAELAGASNAGEGGAAADESGATISEISFWQTVRVPLEQGGVTVSPNAPLIANKPGLLRVYVTPKRDFRARELSLSLELGVGAATDASSSKWIGQASTDADLTSTFNFAIDSRDVLAGTAYSVVLKDALSDTALDRFPTLGTSPLNAATAAPTLEIVVVPIVVAGGAADVSAQGLGVFRARLLALYPLAEIHLSSHAQLISSVAVGPDQGWAQTLDSLYALRAADAPAANVFYFGLLTPAATFYDYCVTDCTVGLSQIASRNDVEYRGAIGLGVFPDRANNDAADTMAHELGHALGRQHSPCMTSDPGPFPYLGGKIGVWGFDPESQLPLDPNDYADVMGYCTPDWISDFTYSALFDRIAYINAQATSASALSLRPVERIFRRVILDARGELSWGSRFALGHAPSGEVIAVTLLDQNGDESSSVAANFQPFADQQGGFLVIPEAALDRVHGVTSIRMGSRSLPLDPL